MRDFSNAQASVGFLSGADDLLTRLLLDYAVFAEPKLHGRATGKMNKFARELRMSDREIEATRALVAQVSPARLGWAHRRVGSPRREPPP